MKTKRTFIPVFTLSVALLLTACNGKEAADTKKTQTTQTESGTEAVTGSVAESGTETAGASGTKLDDLYQQENQIFADHADVWNKVFGMMNKSTADPSGNYADYLADTVEANKDSFSEDELNTLTDDIETIRKIEEQIAELEKEVSQPIAATEDDFLREGRDSLTVGIDALKSRLMKREQIEKNNQRIAELEKSLRMQSEELAQLEGIEFTMAAFSKARTEAIESKINGLFDFVKFRLFETQINGGEVETCEAMVNGVPFSDANTAGQFNAGIDIINAICRFEGISAPIFADGSESVNTLHPTQSQVIRLFVSLDDKLVIKHNGNPAQPKSLFD